MEFKKKSNNELLLEIVFIVYLIFLMGLASAQYQIHFRDTGMLDYIDMDYVRSQAITMIYSLIINIVASVIRTGTVVWGELKFAINRGTALGVIITLQVFVTLLLILRYLCIMGNIINYL